MGILLNSVMLNILKLLSLCLGVVVGQHLTGYHLSPKFSWSLGGPTFDWSKRFGNSGYPVMRRRTLPLMTPDEHHPPLKRFIMDSSYDPGFPMMKKWLDFDEENESDYL